MYSNLVLVLINKELHLKGIQEDSTKKNHSKAIIKKLLIGQCQESFKLFSNTRPTIDPNDSDAEEKEVTYKKKLIGNMKFIGRIFQNRLINRKVIGFIITDLLAEVNNGANVTTK